MASPSARTKMRSAIRTVEKQCEINTATIAREIGEAQKNFLFGAGVKAGGRFVQDQNLSIAHVSAPEQFSATVRPIIHAFSKRRPNI